MRIRIYNANILTMQPGQRMFCGEVHIQDDKIVYLGMEDGAPSLQWDRQINAGGNVVMPGFKDAHTHSAMTFLRSYADDLTLQEWLYDRVFPMEDKLTEEDVFRFRNELDQIMQLLPQLREKEWFDIPAYGTDEWANWMIDLHRKNM